MNWNWFLRKGWLEQYKMSKHPVIVWMLFCLIMLFLPLFLFLKNWLTGTTKAFL